MIEIKNVSKTFNLKNKSVQAVNDVSLTIDTGDIYGIIQKLPYLEELGVEVLWLTPIQLSDSYHGYDISDYTQVDPKFGSKTSPNAIDGEVTPATAMEDYKDLLSAAHEKGMAVIMDLVLNHTSTSNVWFMRSANLDEEYRGFYQWGNHETDGENISEEKHWYPYGDHAYSFYAKFGSGMPELNYSYVPTREAVATMAKQWCEIGVDGFRIDAVKHIFMNDEVKQSSNDTIINDISLNSETQKLQDYSSNLTKNLHFWRSFIADVKESYPNTFFVGENFDGHAYHVAPFYEGFDSMFDFYSYYNITNGAANALNATIGNPITSWDGLHPGSNYSAATDNDPNKGVSGNTSSTGAIKYGGSWDYENVLKAYEKYRTGGDEVSSSTGYSFIGGSFTSNHDISRPINRVAGSKGSSGMDIAANEKGFAPTQNVNLQNAFGRLDQALSNFAPEDIGAVKKAIVANMTYINKKNNLFASGDVIDSDKTLSADEAIENVLGGKIIKMSVGDGWFGGSYYTVLPANTDKSDFEDWFFNLKDSDVGEVYVNGQRIRAESIANDGTLNYDDNNRYTVTIDGDFVRHADGTPLILTYGGKQ